MRAVTVLIACWAAASCSGDGSVTARPFHKGNSEVTVTAPPPVACSRSRQIMVHFGSYAMGIDKAAALKIEQLVGEASGVEEVERGQPGREGEYMLSIKAASAAEACRLQGRLHAALPKKPLGPINITGPLGNLAVP